MRVLLTGGIGYIGSHVAEVLKRQNIPFVIIDDYSNSSKKSHDRLIDVVGSFPFYNIDLSSENPHYLAEVMQQESITHVIHFAAYKSVPESVKYPLMYYRNNVSGMINLLSAMLETEVNNLVFSSSCSVYGNVSGDSPVTENTPTHSQASPYATTKHVCEMLIADSVKATDLKAVCLRYFNPAGASVKLCDPDKFSGALFPSVARMIENGQPVEVYGDDYATRDGSAIRDFIHVVDLAESHVAALGKVSDWKVDIDPLYVNVGTGVGQTVLEIVEAFRSILGDQVEHVVKPRRPGDIGSITADTRLAQSYLGWKPKRSTLEIAQSQIDSYRTHHGKES